MEWSSKDRDRRHGGSYPEWVRDFPWADMMTKDVIRGYVDVAFPSNLSEEHKKRLTTILDVPANINYGIFGASENVMSWLLHEVICHTFRCFKSLCIYPRYLAFAYQLGADWHFQVYQKPNPSRHHLLPVEWNSNECSYVIQTSSSSDEEEEDDDSLWEDDTDDEDSAMDEEMEKEDFWFCDKCGNKAWPYNLVASCTGIDDWAICDKCLACGISCEFCDQKDIAEITSTKSCMECNGEGHESICRCCQMAHMERFDFDVQDMMRHSCKLVGCYPPINFDENVGLNRDAMLQITEQGFIEYGLGGRSSGETWGVEYGNDWEGNFAKTVKCYIDAYLVREIRSFVLSQDLFQLHVPPSQVFGVRENEEDGEEGDGDPNALATVENGRGAEEARAGVREENGVSAGNKNEGAVGNEKDEREEVSGGGDENGNHDGGVGGNTTAIKRKPDADELAAPAAKRSKSSGLDGCVIS